MEESVEPVTLRFSWWGGDSRHEYTQELISLFEAENPGITVEPDFTDWGSYWDRLATTTAAGDTPDVMQHEIRWISEYVSNGVLADMTPYLGSVIDTSNLDTESLAAASVGDATYALPTGVNMFSVVANPAVFEAAGVELPDDTTWTWEDYNEIGSQISANTEDGTFGIQTQGNNEAGLEIYLRQRGQDLYNAEGTDLGFDAATMAEWWQLGLDSVGSGSPSASEAVEIGSAGLDGSLLATNQGAMSLYWSNQLGALSEASGNDLELLRAPGGSEGMFLKPAMFWAMSSESEHPEEAAMLIDFLMNSQAAADIMLTDRGLPVNLAVREAIAPSLDGPNQKAAQFVTTVGAEAGPPTVVPPQGAGEVSGILGRLNEEVLFGQKTVDEAVEAFMAEAREAIGAA